MNGICVIIIFKNHRDRFSPGECGVWLLIGSPSHKNTFISQCELDRNFDETDNNPTTSLSLEHPLILYSAHETRAEMGIYTTG